MTELQMLWNSFCERLSAPKVHILKDSGQAAVSILYTHRYWKGRVLVGRILLLDDDGFLVFIGRPPSWSDVDGHWSPSFSNVGRILDDDGFLVFICRSPSWSDVDGHWSPSFSNVGRILDDDGFLVFICRPPSWSDVDGH